MVAAIKLSDELVIDIAPDGSIYGIELLNANEQLHLGETNELLLVNEATGEHAQVPLFATAKA